MKKRISNRDLKKLIRDEYAKLVPPTPLFDYRGIRLIEDDKYFNMTVGYTSTDPSVTSRLIFIFSSRRLTR